MTACPAFTVAVPTVKLTEPMRMVVAPLALDVAVGGATVALGVGVAVAVALEAVLVLPQAASASTSARPRASKGFRLRLGDPSPHEWSGGICHCKPQRGSAIHGIPLVDYGTLLHMTVLSLPGVYEANFTSKAFIGAPVSAAEESAFNPHGV
jgi:hypothetical protein